MSSVLKVVNKKYILLTELIPQKNATRNYALKTDLKIKWIRPEKISCIKPAKSGDLKPVPKLDKSQYVLDVRDSKEFETADEVVKKLFSLEFAPKKYTNEVYKKQLVEEVKRHHCDETSIEARIAKWTSKIRNLQEKMEQEPRENKKVKVYLKELIEKRKKHLKYLRRWDYKKFEWLLESLDLVYKPYPLCHHMPSRKESLVKLTDLYCDGIKQDRLSKYRQQLENEKVPFLEEKIRTLEFIRNEEQECGIEVTVTQEEIDKVKCQLAELKLKSNSIESK